MNKWLKMVQVLSAVVVFAGGASLSATPAVAAAAGTAVTQDCDCYEQYEAIWDQTGECNAMSSPPTDIYCPYITSCWTDIWGHLHYTGGCFNNGAADCPPLMPIGDCQP